MIKKIVLAIALATAATAAYASCTTHTYMLNGKLVTCTTCCYYGNCNTTCV